jgi:predicted RNA binding protein YcfA (HicA-like mRNA interferase family)
LSRLVPLSPKQIRKRFRQLGFEIVRGADHDFAVKGTLKVRLPNPHRGDVSVGLLAEILRQARIDRDEWLG